MVDRQEVEALLEACEAGDAGWYGATDPQAVAALCRAWLAVEDAEVCTVVDSGWYELGAVYDVSPELVGQRVRIVPVEGDQ